MNKIIEIINEISETGSTKEKENILKNNKDNELLRNVLEYTYNPYKKYKITEKLLDLNGCKNDSLSFNNIFDMLDFLSVNNINNNIRENVSTFISREDRSVQDLYTKIVTKDLRMGCNISTINKVWKDLIPKFSVMLAEKYYDNMKVVEGKNFSITMKEDGNRIVIIKENDNVKCFTRQGQEYEGLDEIVESVKRIKQNNFVIDGELMILNHKDIPSDERYKRTSKIVRKDGIKTGVKVVAFDLVELEAFKNGICYTPYSIRRRLLEHVLKELDSIYLESVELLYSGNDISMINTLLEEVTSRGEEGLMINISDAPYQCKRTKGLLKVKKFQTSDLRVISVVEGEGNFSGMLGSIEVEFEHKGQLHRCNCGTGFSQDERIRYFNNPELLINRIVEIKYFEISSNDKGGYGLRFPVFTGRVRNDKNEISMY